MNKEKYSRYEKLKLYVIACFGMFSLSMYAENQTNQFDKRRIGDDAVKIDIIINKDDIVRSEDEDTEDTYNNETGDLIYLDQIQDEEEEKIQKKKAKPNKIERFIKKIDEKFNPTRKFWIAKSYGIWYLLKTEDVLETNLGNIRYDFIQQQNGYKIVKSYFDPKSNIWSENSQRAWIEEKKGNVYLEVEKKYFKNKKNEILFFDKNYRYMIIKFDDGFIRVLSRYPNNEKISLEDEELAEFNHIVDNKSNLKNIYYDINVKSIREIEAEQKKKILKEKTDELERQLSENPELVFQIDTIGAKRAFKGKIKSKDVKFETKKGTKKVEVIELDDKDLKNEIENKNSTEINRGN